MTSLLSNSIWFIIHTDLQVPTAVLDMAADPVPFYAGTLGNFVVTFVFQIKHPDHFLLVVGQFF
jgi:hypothetical protein